MRLLAVVAIAAALAGCFKVTYTNPALPMNGQVVEQKGSFFIFGLAGNAEIPVYQMCPGGVSEIRSGHGVGDIVLTILTLGIYTPRSYEIACGGGQ
ncbi:MAG: hypothetical protein JO257_32815 [Deltaproteobacteria bacterium]|nr:hypothetical protein [Deltaproteobacteria bacterium]